LAEEAGIPYGTLYGYDNGTRRVSKENAKKIAEILKIKSEDILQMAAKSFPKSELREGAPAYGDPGVFTVHEMSVPTLQNIKKELLMEISASPPLAAEPLIKRLERVNSELASKINEDADRPLESRTGAFSSTSRGEAANILEKADALDDVQHGRVPPQPKPSTAEPNEEKDPP